MTIDRRLGEIERKLRANRLKALKGLMDGLGEADICEMVSGGRCFSFEELKEYDPKIYEFLQEQQR